MPHLNLQIFLRDLNLKMKKLNITVYPVYIEILKEDVQYSFIFACEDFEGKKREGK